MNLRELDCGPCPYLEGRNWRIQDVLYPQLDPSNYEDLLAAGFRRSGENFYRNICPGCGYCVPIRLEAGTFKASRSQRKLERLNAEIKVQLLPSAFSEERFLLYCRYMDARHGSKEEAVEALRQSYERFLIISPFSTSMVTEYRLPDDRLVATGYLDVLPGGFSSVYFAFDPVEARRSLGTWSVTQELNLAASLGLRYYYLGFWVPRSPKMDYKANFRPFEYARNGHWIPASDKGEALATLESP